MSMQDEFASDIASITSSKAYRLLDDKTQVLTKPSRPFIRTRGKHVAEVMADAVVVADMLGLNVSLVQAIAYGHDIGHVPGGHPGEHYLAKRMGKKEFCHEVLGPLIMQKVERNGKGINLTFETLEGMRRHSGRSVREGMTQEAFVVRYMDKVAYLFADYNDITQRTNFPVSRDIHQLMNEFGKNHRERTTTAMAGLIVESAETGKVRFENSPLAVKFDELRTRMLDVYFRITEQDLESLIDPVLRFLEGLDIGNPYLAFSLMTDKDLIFLSSCSARNYTHLEYTALFERLPYLKELQDLDLCNPYLDW